VTGGTGPQPRRQERPLLHQRVGAGAATTAMLLAAACETRKEGVQFMPEPDRVGGECLVAAVSIDTCNAAPSPTTGLQPKGAVRWQEEMLSSTCPHKVHMAHGSSTALRCVAFKVGYTWRHSASYQAPALQQATTRQRSTKLLHATCESKLPPFGAAHRCSGRQQRGGEGQRVSARPTSAADGESAHRT